MTSYIPLEKLDVYLWSREFSQTAWSIFENMDWQMRKGVGYQMVRSVDSVGANIAEGYGRFHYLDKCKFYYNARGSLLESRHWFSLMYERNIIREDIFLRAKYVAKQIHCKLNALIQTQRAQNTKT